jgi:hypothetical protein
VLYLNTNLKNVREAFVLAKREAEERAKEKDKKKREMKPINPIRKALIRHVSYMIFNKMCQKS